MIPTCAQPVLPVTPSIRPSERLVRSVFPWYTHKEEGDEPAKRHDEKILSSLLFSSLLFSSGF